MSDPVTNVEIEDILSSIRRLVSDEDRSDETEDKQDDNRLVLTPSLRVHAPGDADESDDDPTAQEADAADVQEDIATERADDYASDDVQPPESDAQDDGEAEGLRARIAALEESVASTADQWEPDGPSDDDYAGGPVEALPWEDHFEDGDDGSADAYTAEDAPETEQHVEETGHDWPAEQEDMLRDEPSDYEEASDIEDAESTASRAGTVDTEERAATAEMNELLGGDAILDEEALREVIADIVRQELQGSLGERITRNVRKLVRREIHRALASHDLE
ncbi:MAG: hypothetical protein FH759_09735 [Sediminimonas qiaohouensis]|uniref:Uncharacterized protein n=1 Tax=Sediminimonas qiaohouensis TaxID=552061 RepID=A0A7C9LB95_9RHOB|nr:hypothetical protein [Sediminimonas qiaohouensis]MTJ04957.1 hypothetical protein [Sediminimonas qiaohouensis]